MNYSLITIGYKSLDNIIKSIEEAKNSTLPPKEIIVIINSYAYNDQTPKILQYVSSSKDITRWVYCSQNIGCAKAFNIGFSLATQEVMVALSDDCRVGPNTYELMMQEFNNHRVGIVGVKNGDPFRVIAEGYLLAFRAQMIKEIGGYDEIASPLADETEFALRAYHHMWESAIAPGCQWSHVHDISNNPTHLINYLGEEMSPQGFNAFQYRTEEILKKKRASYTV